MASVSLISRDATASFYASLPHPLYLDRPRQASTTKDRLSYGATAIHVDFVYAHPGREEPRALPVPGPSFASVSADVVTR